jgi:hypothetical protein
LIGAPHNARCDDVDHIAAAGDVVHDQPGRLAKRPVAWSSASRSLRFSPIPRITTSTPAGFKRRRTDVGGLGRKLADGQVRKTYPAGDRCSCIDADCWCELTCASAQKMYARHRTGNSRYVSVCYVRSYSTPAPCCAGWCSDANAIKSRAWCSRS